jgi:hypothetical protein
MSKPCATPRSNSLRGAIALTIAAACVLMAAACGGPAAPRPASHGLLVAHLAIPFLAAGPAGRVVVVRVTVQVGQRFSIKVDTSDGPYYWAQSGAKPDRRIIRTAGDINDGNCAPDLVGCRVPYFHALVARAAGATTITWQYHALRCQNAPGASTPRPGSCPAVTMVRFDIRVR